MRVDEDQHLPGGVLNPKDFGPDQTFQIQSTPSQIKVDNVSISFFPKKKGKGTKKKEDQCIYIYIYIYIVVYSGIYIYIYIYIYIVDEEDRNVCLIMGEAG